jgi:methionine-rich copper-binding protein CopC
VIVLVLAAVLVVPALAHGQKSSGKSAQKSTSLTVTSEQPTPNQVLTSAPSKVTLDFSSALSKSGDDALVYDQKGAVTSEGPLVINGKTMTVNLKSQGNGTYLVVWHATASSGGTPAIGAYTFNVGSAGATSGTVGATYAPMPSSGVPWWIALVTGIAGLIIGGVAGRMLMGRSASPASARSSQSTRSTTRSDKQPSSTAQ